MINWAWIAPRLLLAVAAVLVLILVLKKAGYYGDGVD